MWGTQRLMVLYKKKNQKKKMKHKNIYIYIYIREISTRSQQEGEIKRSPE